MSINRTLHFVPEPGEIAIELRDGRLVRFHIPDDVTTLEAARLMELTSVVAYSGVTQNMNIDLTIEAFGLERCLTCGDRGMEELDARE